MIVVGLTGGIGSGKSTVAALLADRGAVIVDADAVARQVVEPGQPAHQAVIDHFGPGVVGPDGRLDRAAVAARVFSDPDALAALNAITHPAIAAVMAARIAEQADRDAVVVLDLPLFTAASRSRYRLAGVMVVDAPIEVAVRRLVDQRGLSEDDARARVAAQPSRDARRQLADLVVDNSGSRDDLAGAAERAWNWMRQLRAGDPGGGTSPGPGDR